MRRGETDRRNLLIFELERDRPQQLGVREAVCAQRGVDARNAERVDEEVGCGVVADHGHQMQEVHEGRLQSGVELAQNARPGLLVTVLEREAFAARAFTCLFLSY